MKLSGLTRESVLEALQHINLEKLSRSQANSDYQVEINGQYYPFKMLVEKSYKIATGSALSEGTFKEYFYLIKQFEAFTGFTVKVAGPILLRAKVKNELNILLSAEMLIHTTEDKQMDLSMLGPSFIDEAVRKRRFRNEMGFDDIKPGHLFLLTTQEAVYGLVQVVPDEAVTRPRFPVRVLILTPPLAHGLDFSDESYPIVEASYYGDHMKQLCQVIENFDAALIPKSIEIINGTRSESQKFNNENFV